MECQFNRSYAIDSFDDDDQEPQEHETLQDSCDGPDGTDRCKESQKNENQNPAEDAAAADDDPTESWSESYESESPKEHDHEVPDEEADSLEERVAAGHAMVDALVDDVIAQIRSNADTGSAWASESSQPAFREQGDPCAFGQGDAAAGIPDIVDSGSDSNDGGDDGSDSQHHDADQHDGADRHCAEQHGGAGRHSCKECVPVGRCPGCGAMLRRHRGA